AAAARILHAGRAAPRGPRAAVRPAGPREPRIAPRGVVQARLQPPAPHRAGRDPRLSRYHDGPPGRGRTGNGTRMTRIGPMRADLMGEGRTTPNHYHSHNLYVKFIIIKNIKS